MNLFKRKERKQNYSHREWLNGDNSSTGSVVAYSGLSPWKEYKDYYQFLEIADCKTKVRLHRNDFDSLDDYIKKLEILRTVIDNFIYYLEEQEKEKNVKFRGYL